MSRVSVLLLLLVLVLVLVLLLRVHRVEVTAAAGHALGVLLRLRVRRVVASLRVLGHVMLQWLLRRCWGVGGLASVLVPSPAADEEEEDNEDGE